MCIRDSYYGVPIAVVEVGAVEVQRTLFGIGHPLETPWSVKRQKVLAQGLVWQAFAERERRVGVELIESEGKEIGVEGQAVDFVYGQVLPLVECGLPVLRPLACHREEGAHGGGHSGQ